MIAVRKIIVKQMLQEVGMERERLLQKVPRFVMEGASPDQKTVIEAGTDCLASRDQEMPEQLQELNLENYRLNAERTDNDAELVMMTYMPTFPRSNTFPGYSSRRDAANYNLAFQGRQMRPDSLKFLLPWTNHRPAKRKISKPLVYDQVSSLGSPFALYDPLTVINPDAPKVD